MGATPDLWQASPTIGSSETWLPQLHLSVEVGAAVPAGVSLALRRPALYCGPQHLDGIACL